MLAATIKLIGRQLQCSRLKPSYEFHLKGYQISALELKGWFGRQSKSIVMKYKTHTKLVNDFFGARVQYNVKG